MKYINESFEGERSLFALKNSTIENCHFLFGESPLKESKNLKINSTTFEWKYPMWYANDIVCENIKLTIDARSGIWYSNNVFIKNSTIDAPKTFRRAKDIHLENVTFNNASETLWNCKDIKIINSSFKGDYLLMNSKNVYIDKLHLEGNYFFDGGENLEISNSYLDSKDAFWNCKNVIIKNSIIHGEYIGWNSKNITFIDCEIISHQGFCYMENVKLVNTKIIDSDLIFEYSENIDAEIVNKVQSIKNPASGIIKVKGVDELIIDEKYIDPTKIKIVVEQ